MENKQNGSRIILFKLEKIMNTFGDVEKVNNFLHRIENQEIKKVSRSILNSYINRNFTRMKNDALFIEGLAKFIHFSALKKVCINLRVNIQEIGISNKTLDSLFADLLLHIENLSDSIRLFLSKVSYKSLKTLEKPDSLFNYSNLEKLSCHPFQSCQHQLL